MEWIQKFIERGQYSSPENTFIIRNILIDCLSNNAYWICMFIGMGGVISYICGFKKGGKVAKFSIVIYWVVAAICSIE